MVTRFEGLTSFTANTFRHQIRRQTHNFAPTTALHTNVRNRHAKECAALPRHRVALLPNSPSGLLSQPASLLIEISIPKTGTPVVSTFSSHGFDSIWQIVVFYAYQQRGVMIRRGDCPTRMGSFQYLFAFIPRRLHIQHVELGGTYGRHTSAAIVVTLSARCIMLGKPDFELTACRSTISGTKATNLSAERTSLCVNMSSFVSRQKAHQSPSQARPPYSSQRSSMSFFGVRMRVVLKRAISGKLDARRWRPR